MDLDDEEGRVLVHSTDDTERLSLFIFTFVRGPVYTDICVLFGFKTRVGY